VEHLAESQKTGKCGGEVVLLVPYRRGYQLKCCFALGNVSTKFATRARPKTIAVTASNLTRSLFLRSQVKDCAPTIFISLRGAALDSING